MDCYDKQGQEITLQRWTELHGNLEYRRIDQTYVNSLIPFRTSIWISTTWLGLNHSFGDGPPLIFETMVFGNDDDDEEAYRTSTVADAQQMHREVLSDVLSRHRFVYRSQKPRFWERRN